MPDSGSSGLRRAAAIGAVTGSRSMLGAALVARAIAAGSVAAPRRGLLRLLSHRRAVVVTSVLAAGEVVGDKLPGAPSRLGAGPLLGRLVVGAALGGVLADAGARARVAGALGALCGALSGAAWRDVVDRRTGAPDAAAAVAEDLVALLVGRTAAAGQGC